MNVKINEQYRITSDQHNFILERRIESKDSSKEKWRQIEFYTKLDYLLGAVKNHLLRKSSAESLSGLLKDAEAIDRVLGAIRQPNRLTGAQNASEPEKENGSPNEN